MGCYRSLKFGGKTLGIERKMGCAQPLNGAPTPAVAQLVTGRLRLLVG